MGSIRLIPNRGVSIDLQLYKEKKPYTVERVLNEKKQIFDDLNYTFELIGEFKGSDVSVYFNDESVKVVKQANKIFVQTENSAMTTFGGRIGFLQISICFHDDIDGDEWFYTDFVSVLIKAVQKNNSIISMMNYVYENQEDFLFNDISGIVNGKNTLQSYDDFWSQILMLEDIAKIYENLFGYFKANCRMKLSEYEVIDRADKLQNVDARTVQYIAQHPEYLKRDVGGIEYGVHQHFMPIKTMMLQNKITYDIYENQVVVSFLKRVYSDICQLKQTIETYIVDFDFEQQTQDGYIVSAYILYKNATDTLQEFLGKVKQLEEKIGNLYMSYRSILQVKEIDFINRPTPTAIFMSVPQYNQIYTCITNWFEKTGYDFVKEKFMVGFFDAASVYEMYVLIKLIKLIQSHGYTLMESKNVQYRQISGAKHKQKDHNNTFIFSNDEQDITLYYEPVIYDVDSQYINGIGLYRNNTISLSNDVEEERNGHYYVPDYVIKSEVNGKERYIICDAKYTRLHNVKHRCVPELSYKYLFSFSTIDDNKEIKGLNIFYGKPEMKQDAISFFDKKIEGTRENEPFVNLIPLTEEIPYESQFNSIFAMLQGLLSDR